MGYTYNGILFSFKKKEILPFATTWLDLKGFMLSKIGQTQKDLSEQSKIVKPIEAENRREVARGCREGKRRVVFSGEKVSVMQDEKVLELCRIA